MILFQIHMIEIENLFVFLTQLVEKFLQLFSLENELFGNEEPDKAEPLNYFLLKF